LAAKQLVEGVSAVLFALQTGTQSIVKAEAGVARSAAKPIRSNFRTV
jgi:hypothetical protein